jgi:hypothetical protein
VRLKHNLEGLSTGKCMNPILQDGATWIIEKSRYGTHRNAIIEKNAWDGSL